MASQAGLRATARRTRSASARESPTLTDSPTPPLYGSNHTTEAAMHNTPKMRFYETLVSRMEANAVPFPPPRLFYKGQCVENHLEAVERYINAASVSSNKAKSSALLHSLEEAVQLSVFSQPDYHGNECDYMWLCYTLKRLYGRKDDALSVRVHLLSVLQANGQSPSEYASALRVEAYNRWLRGDPEEKETFLLKAFLHGLENKRTATAIKALKPRNLEEAVKYAQRLFQEEGQRDTGTATGERLRMVKETGHRNGAHAQPQRLFQEEGQRDVEATGDRLLLEVNVVRQLQQQVAELLKKVSSLERMLQNARTDQSHEVKELVNYNRGNKHQYVNHATTPRKPIKCFNCDKEGHIARDCPKPRNRRPQNRRPFLRQVKNEPSIALSEELDNASRCGTDEANDETETCCVLTYSHPHQTHPFNARQAEKEKNKASFYTGSKQEQETAQAWTEFITGEKKKPKTETARAEYQHTLISHNHSELARNKPVVVGKCAGVKTKIFIDSGAEMNVIDADFLNDLKISQKAPVKFMPAASTIQCANGSRMVVTGHAILSIQIGNAKVEQKFMVVKRIFPKVIIGLRTMKTMSIAIDAKNDGIVVDDRIRVPFLSRTVPESVAQGNGNRAVLGVETSPGKKARLLSELF